MSREVMPNLGFLMSTDALVSSEILTIGNSLLDAHELEALRAGARMIGSITTCGYLTTLRDHQSGEIEHLWEHDH
jgi:hypothetical protein